ncbi:Wzz/FepE/Etk N-terminal domain-containing protein [Vibrio parahaemolyticus]|uniref:Wzz/FepE/Etk N-terminal domain-containing protein n=1 Tax=Vibrio parahaemolyticus TaxID=670 RepID=UPI0004D3E4AD|nr:Wzz/FepE/Etk N-terminal domain-containing protein [Vibrio parahaemolyticus]ODX22929.1 lipopolysaccharide biosynthesis protein [Vibrio parahaemolyticus]OQU22230.1 LPS O-antigen length regulator [Vibrio parahaemolyticus]
MELKKEPHLNDDIEFRELLTAIWKGKWFIFGITLMFAVSSIFYTLSLPNTYKASALLAPSESSTGGSLSKIAGQFGGIAALAGVNLSGGETSQADLAIQVLKSRQFVESFIEKHDLIIPLMAVKDWDMRNDQLIIDDNIYDKKNNEWLRNAKELRKPKPSAQEAFDVFSREIINITKDKENGLYRISVSYYSPFVAQQWVNWLIADINNVMRERVLKETSLNLSYLKSQLQKTSVAEMQSTFYKLIEEQTKSLMLAEVQDEFVFKTIDPAVAPEIKSGPKRALIVIFCTLLGGILSVGGVLIRTILK